MILQLKLKTWIKFKIVKTKNIFCIFTLKEVEQANLFRVCDKYLRYRNIIISSYSSLLKQGLLPMQRLKQVLPTSIFLSCYRPKRRTLSMLVEIWWYHYQWCLQKPGCWCAKYAKSVFPMRENSTNIWRVTPTTPPMFSKPLKTYLHLKRLARKHWLKTWRLSGASWPKKSLKRPWKRTWTAKNSVLSCQPKSWS